MSRTPANDFVKTELNVNYDIKHKYKYDIDAK